LHIFAGECPSTQCKTFLPHIPFVATVPRKNLTQKYMKSKSTPASLLIEYCAAFFILFALDIK